jgi:GNAT superfamily N-acetyltransferase
VSSRQPLSTPAVSFRFAKVRDIEALLPLMRDFYVFERLRFEETRQRQLVSQLVQSPDLGRLILFEHTGELLGYMVLGFGFSLEFHGRDCLLDEFYVVPEHRSKGIGRAAVEFAIATCREMGIRAVHLEADYVNVRGHEFYKRLGFKDHERHLMTLWI